MDTSSQKARTVRFLNIKHHNLEHIISFDPAEKQGVIVPSGFPPEADHPGATGTRRGGRSPSERTEANPAARKLSLEATVGTGAA